MISPKLLLYSEFYRPENTNMNKLFLQVLSSQHVREGMEANVEILSDVKY